MSNTPSYWKKSLRAGGTLAMSAFFCVLLVGNFSDWRWAALRLRDLEGWVLWEILGMWASTLLIGFKALEASWRRRGTSFGGLCLAILALTWLMDFPWMVSCYLLAVIAGKLFWETRGQSDRKIIAAGIRQMRFAAFAAMLGLFGTLIAVIFIAVFAPREQDSETRIRMFVALGGMMYYLALGICTFFFEPLDRWMERRYRETLGDRWKAVTQDDETHPV